MTELLEQTHAAKFHAERQGWGPALPAPVAERPARVELRRQIGALERVLSGLLASAYPRQGIDLGVPAAGGPRLLGIAELERVRDALAGYRGRHAVMSFDPRVSIWFARHSPQTVRGLVMREDEIGMTQKAWQRHMALCAARPEFIAYHVAALPNRMVAALRKRGMPVLTWTVDSPEARAQGSEYADALIAEGKGLA